MKPLTSFTQITDTNDFDAIKSSAGLTIVPILEAESIVQSLESFPVQEIGCTPFLRMYGYEVERLTLQAHACAKNQDGDEYVVDAILTHGKLSILVQTLLAVEAWRTFVLESNSSSSSKQSKLNECNDSEDVSPSTSSLQSLAEMMAENQSSLRCAFILHVETTLVSLLNVIMFRKENCEELDCDTAVALVDYCARQMVSAANNCMILCICDFRLYTWYLQI